MGSTQNKSLADLKNKKLLQTKGYINGEWCDAKSGKTFEVVDPATGDTIATLPEMGKEDTARAIDAAHEAFQTWKLTDGRTRARLLRKWNDLCIANADDLALILTLENGKPLPEAKGEVLYGTSFIEWFAGEAERRFYNTRTTESVLTHGSTLELMARISPPPTATNGSSPRSSPSG
jgi:succinate-semialdehyde dehydrogenase/glutarate-semialdehyde dehydrogenase